MDQHHKDQEQHFFNIFRILGDLSHTLSKVILVWAIHKNRSAEGVSLITQVLYCFVFCARYLNIFTAQITGDWRYIWNFVLKIFYLSTSFYIVFAMMRVFARTREREKGWKLGGYSLIGSAVAAPLVYLITLKAYPERWRGLGQVFWMFSEILEATCVLPQLLLLRQTTVPTVIDSYYLVTLGSYRALYILNWIYRKSTQDGYLDPVSWIFGTVQTALYIDFAWVYYTRQRVKLRNGGVVDNDDLSRGWLIGRVLGRKSMDTDEESTPALADERGEATNSRGGGTRTWGARGISVSADEGVLDSRRKANRGGARDETEPLTDPQAFEDDDSDQEEESNSGSEQSSDSDESNSNDAWAEERPAK